MKIESLALPGVLLLTPRVFEDARGTFVETYRQESFAAFGVGQAFVQDNEVYTHRAGTIRGLHYQAAPFAQAKLVRVLAGEIFDVVADVCPTSPTFGRWLGVPLSAQSGSLLYIPAGYAHGYATKTDAVRVSYKVDAPYRPHSERAVRWDDPTLAVDWGVSTPLVSMKDAQAPALSAGRAEDFPAGFPPPVVP